MLSHLIYKNFFGGIPIKRDVRARSVRDDIGTAKQKEQHMISELMSLFTGDRKEPTENEVLRQKFKRISQNRTTAPAALRVVDPSMPVIRPHQRLISHWTEAAQAEIEQSRFYDQEPHVMQTINNSGTLMQPGSAEMFLTCKPHPLDELNERRRKAEEVDNTRRFFEFSKRVKNSA